MLKKHVLSLHNEVSSFKSRMSKKKQKIVSPTVAPLTVINNIQPAKKPEEIQLKYNRDLKLVPGTMMTIYKCPVDSCNKRSCTDMKSFKLHCLHIHQNMDILPMVEEVEAKYLCQVEGCGKLYLERKQYDIHQRHHKSYVPSKGRYFKCDHCDSKFNTQGNLDVHIIQTHMRSGADDKPATESGKNELIFDSITLEPGTTMTVYHCPVADCNKRNYLDGKSVRTHCRRVHGMIDYEGIPSQAEAQYICQVRGCRKLFMEQVQIEAHLKHHRNYVPTNGVFECKCCPETFTRKEHLDKHILTFHTVSGLAKQPQAAQIVTVDGQQYIQHIQPQPQEQQVVSQPQESSSTGKVVGYQCSICMRKFLHLGTHCNHVTNSHQAPGLAPIEVEIKPRYTCKYPRCGRHFMTKNMFKAHTDRHQNGKNKKAMNCFKCGRNFSQFKSLYQHVVQTHADVTPDEIAELEAAHAKCPVCLAVFRSVDIMKVHLRRHPGYKDKSERGEPPSKVFIQDEQNDGSPAIVKPAYGN